MLFSVIIATRNRRQLLENSIKRLQSLNYDDFEIIIIDDGSTNYEIDYLNSIRSSRVRTFSQPHRGVSAARNFGASESIGDYLIFLDDDDEVGEHWLYAFGEVVRDKQKPDLIYCGIRIQNFVTGEVSIYTPVRELWRFVLTGCWALKREIFMKIQGYDTRLRYGENTELFMRLGQIPHTEAKIMDVNFTYKISGTGGGRNPQNIIDSNVLLLRKHRDYFAGKRRLASIYNRIAGVNCLKMGNKIKARNFFLEALRLYPLDFKTAIRVFMTYF